jgi:hypothetical protein
MPCAAASPPHEEQPDAWKWRSGSPSNYQPQKVDFFDNLSTDLSSPPHCSPRPPSVNVCFRPIADAVARLPG